MFLQSAEKYTKWWSAICDADCTALADESHQYLINPRALIPPTISFVIAPCQAGPAALEAAFIPPLLCGQLEEVPAVPQLMPLMPFDQT